MRGEILLAIMLIPATMLIPALGVRGDTVYCKYEGYDKETTLSEDVLVTNQLKDTGGQIARVDYCFWNQRQGRLIERFHLRQNIYGRKGEYRIDFSPEAERNQIIQKMIENGCTAQVTTACGKPVRIHCAKAQYYRTDKLLLFGSWPEDCEIHLALAELDAIQHIRFADILTVQFVGGSSVQVTLKDGTTKKGRWKHEYSDEESGKISLRGLDSHGNVMDVALGEGVVIDFRSLRADEATLPRSTLPGSDPKPETPRTLRPSESPPPTADHLPRFKTQLKGRNEVRVRNPNNFQVVAGLRAGQGGCDLQVSANAVASVFVPDGEYDIYFVYSSKPEALFQGDSFTLKGNGVEIQIVKVVGGNYGIRRVR